MKIQFYIALIFTLFVNLLGYSLIAQSDHSQLQKGFENPPNTARPKVYYWWLNGLVDTLRVKTEIEAMDQAGISGFDIFEIGAGRGDSSIKPGPAFLSKESLASIRVALREAKERNMEVGLNLASSWNAGGTWISPENSAKSLYFSQILITENSPKAISIPFPEIPKATAGGKKSAIEFRSDGKPVFYKDVAIVAVPVVNGKLETDPEKFVDLTQQFDPEKEELKWTFNGDWEVFRYVCSNSGEQLKLPSPNSAGPIIDHFDSAATRAHFHYILDRIKSVMGEDLGKTALKSLYLASYEATGFVWTQTLPEVFMKINGYNGMKYLPLLFNQDYFDPQGTEKFLVDYRRTLSELMVTNFYQEAKKIAHENGLKINSESGGPGLPLHNVPVEPLKALGVMDLPRGEFWIKHDRFNEIGIDILRVVKEVSAASHIYERGIVEEEAFTSFMHWQEGPFDMKPMGDRAFAEGMNRVVVHGFSHNPSEVGYPGSVYGAGTHFNDKRIWFNKVRPFTDYLSRISYLLQETEFFADVLYYYGDATPNYAGHKNSRFAVGPGYDYEVVNTEILLKATVDNQKVVLPNGARFSVLALENEGEIHPDVLLKLEELLKEGATIVGLKPEKVSDMPGKRPEMKEMIAHLWNQEEDFKIMEKSPLEVLNSLEIGPDFEYVDVDLNTLDYIHYDRAGMNFYFIRNTTGDWVSREVGFRAPGKFPELWDPLSGKVESPSIFRHDHSYTRVPISLAPYGSVFVVLNESGFVPTYEKLESRELFPPKFSFENDRLFILEEGLFELKKGGEKLPVQNLVKQQAIDGAWEVFFSPEWGGPERMIFPELISWTESEVESIKYYSGIARYKKTFQYDINASFQPEQKVFLDLGDLSKIGEVWLNGVSLGIAWAKPYRFDLTDILKAGDNLLEIEVANVWSNRLTGDAQTEGKDYTSTNVKHTDINGLNKIDVPWVAVPLIQSGLFGPVNLITVSPVY